MEKIKYKVCIRCYTYNQSKYILDALYSFVSQITNFPFIIVVVDDNSSDNEPQVIRSFVNEQFDVSDENVAYEKETELANIIYAQHAVNKNCYIAAVLLKRNLYAEKSIKRAIVDEWRNQSKYEALCEGDDWWLSERKLQKQFDALESHPDINICACGTNCFKNGVLVNSICPSSTDCVLSVEDTIIGGGAYLGTNSLMLRINIFKDNYIFWRFMGLDYFQQIHGALPNGVLYISEKMAAYRVSSDGSWVSNMKKNKDRFFYHKEKVISALNLLDYETQGSFHKTIMRAKQKLYLNQLICGLQSGVYTSNAKLKTRCKLLLICIKLLFS